MFHTERQIYYDSFHTLFKHHSTVWGDLVYIRERMLRDNAMSCCDPSSTFRGTGERTSNQGQGPAPPTPLETLSLVASALHDQEVV